MAQASGDSRIWEGHPSQWINFGLYLICLLTCFLVIPLFIAGWRWLVTKCTHYELTTQRIFLSTGVFNKKTDALELYRVLDLQIAEPFFLRLFGLGNVVLTTSDRTTPTFTFRAIHDPRTLADMLRKHVEACRVAKGTREIDFVDNDTNL
ncbi:MAG TPA: PH domain-containing protein [Candidatus Hydrogenedentes bacterium]|nr:PH domain-containing protein [Candidatus Hydrogenedentota bacterium]